MAKASGFYRSSSDAIDWIKYSLQDTVWNAQNIGDTEIKGIELELGHQVFNWLKYTVGYTYLDNRFKEFDNGYSRYVLDNLKHQLVTKLQTKFLKNFTNELVYRYNERVNLGSYNLLDAKLNYTRNDLSVYVLVNNLTNSEYTYNINIK